MTIDVEVAGTLSDGAQKGRSPRECANPEGRDRSRRTVPLRGSGVRSRGLCVHSVSRSVGRRVRVETHNARRSDERVLARGPFRLGVGLSDRSRRNSHADTHRRAPRSYGCRRNDACVRAQGILLPALLYGRREGRHRDADSRNSCEALSAKTGPGYRNNLLRLARRRIGNGAASCGVDCFVWMAPCPHLDFDDNYRWNPRGSGNAGRSAQT